MLTFRLGRIPVRVHVWFVAAAVLLGVSAGLGPLGASLVTVGCLLTVLANELGHAAAAKAFGVAAEVHLTLLRGNLGARIGSLSPARRFAVFVAGPAVGIAIGAIGLGLLRLHVPASDLVAHAARYVAWINLGWGLLNLVPVVPLDGGFALLAVLDGITRGRGRQATHWVSFVIAAVVAVVAIRAKAPLLVVLCGAIALQNFRGLRTREMRDRDSQLREELKAAFAAMDREDSIAAIRRCKTILRDATDAATRIDAIRLLAYAFATTEAWAPLMQLLESGGARALADGELEKYQKAATELGRSDEARRISFLRARVA